MTKKLATLTSLAFGLLCLARLATAENIYVSTANQLLRFDSASPGTVTSTLTVTGLQGGETLLGIDVRPANGLLYALGSTGRLYRIDPSTGASTRRPARRPRSAPRSPSPVPASVSTSTQPSTASAW